MSDGRIELAKELVPARVVLYQEALLVAKLGRREQSERDWFAGSRRNKCPFRAALKQSESRVETDDIDRFGLERNGVGQDGKVGQSHREALQFAHACAHLTVDLLQRAKKE